MTREQVLLWRQTAIMGILLALMAILSFIGTISLGLNATYFEQAITRGHAPPLFEIERGFDYGYYALLVSFFFSMRFLLAGVFALMLRQILILPQDVMLHQMVILGVMGMMGATLLNLMSILYAVLYATDESRAMFIGMSRVPLFIFSHLGIFTISTVTWGAYRARSLPRYMVAILAGLAVMGFWLTLAGLNPQTPLIVGVLPLMLSVILITAQVSLVAFSIRLGRN